MTYNRIDEELFLWAKSHSINVFKKFSGRDARFFYVSSSTGECFQVSLELLNDTQLKVDAWSVDTINDEDMHDSWMVPINRLVPTLTLALSKVDSWMKRSL